jgi:hypothetical protein
MTDFHDWLSRVLDHGESVQDSPPSLPPRARPAAVEALRAAFVRHALDAAGPPIPFDPDIAVEAAGVLARACWALVAAEPAAVELDAEPASPSAHLSADVALRVLPGVYRRARAGDPSGELVAGIDRVLRRWPLSGVLADLDGGPTTPPDFGGHPGLQLLYAERLAHTGRPGWVPADGPAREWAERVYSEHGRPLPALLTEGTRD